MLLFKSEIKDIVIKKIKKTIDDADIELCVDEAIQLTMDYCNINAIPMGLKYTVVNIACDIVSTDILGDKYSDEIKAKSVSRGDTSITYEALAVKEKSDIVPSYAKELNRFRKVRR